MNNPYSMIEKELAMLTNIDVVKKDGHIEPFSMTKLLTAVRSAARDIHVTLSQDDLKQIEKKVYQYVNAQTILLPQDLHWLAIEATRSVNPDVAKSYEDFHRKKQALKSSDLTKLKVVSKLGIVSAFDTKRILEACQKAATAIGKQLTKDQENQILSDVAHWLDTPKYRDTVATSDLHRIVMGALKKADKDVYTSYKRYWQTQREHANAFRDLQNEAEGLRFGSYNENANKDSQVISTKSALINEMTMKKLVRNVLKPEWIKAHEEGYIYIHEKIVA